MQTNKLVEKFEESSAQIFFNRLNIVQNNAVRFNKEFACFPRFRIK